MLSYTNHESKKAFICAGTMPNLVGRPNKMPEKVLHAKYIETCQCQTIKRVRTVSDGQLLWRNQWHIAWLLRSVHSIQHFLRQCFSYLKQSRIDFSVSTDMFNYYFKKKIPSRVKIPPAFSRPLHTSIASFCTCPNME